jgi:aminomethyltransferase
MLRKLVGVKLLDRGVPREGYPILRAGEQIGALTSGTMLPTVGIAAGMGYVAPADAQPDAEIAVEIRGKAVPATFAPLPFYKRNQ